MVRQVAAQMPRTGASSGCSGRSTMPGRIEQVQGDVL
jgi:hypothetical protein